MADTWDMIDVAWNHLLHLAALGQAIATASSFRRCQKAAVSQISRRSDAVSKGGISLI